MSHLLLWKHYTDDDVEKFRRVLASTSTYTHANTHPHAHGAKSHIGAPSHSFGSSPASLKTRKVSGPSARGNPSAHAVNSRDHAGLTLMQRAASNTTPSAVGFALALVEHPAIDLYVQDRENGWTALHRALYFGNVAVARAILERDRREMRGGMSVIKVKDHEGNSPFDVYNATIARRALGGGEAAAMDCELLDEDESEVLEAARERAAVRHALEGDELFVFGSNKNHSLGFGDGDDRLHPERISLKRPDHLLFRFYREYIEEQEDNETFHPAPKSLEDLPTLILNRPVIIQDVTLSKLHSAVLTTDPESNLYMCGFGPGGRLGTGDEVTRFTYTCIEGGALAGKKIVTVALGQNHTLAVSYEGEIFSWGTSTYGQLGYSLPRPTLKDEEPICATPRQIFGPLKRETIIGVAASAIHSVAHSATSLFCWGKNEGQLGLMDSDSRSLAVQAVPRKVAASLFKAPITMVSAINGATICLLANHSVTVFSNYGYNIVKFPLYGEFNYHLRSAALTTRYEDSTNHISYITAGGDTIAAVSSRGDLFTLNITKVDSDLPLASTTNPSKIKSALSAPQRVWSLRKGHWDGVRSVGIAENGSVIVCTHAGSVWRRVQRPNAKDAFSSPTSLARKDYKFQRVPGLTKVVAVRSTTFGVYAAVRCDCDVTKSQIRVDKQNLWEDVAPLLSISGTLPSEPTEEETDAPRFWTPALPADLFDPLKRAVLISPDIEADIVRHLASRNLDDYDVEVCTTSSEVRIPVHGFMLTARSSILRSALAECRETGESSMTDIFVVKDATPSGAISRPKVQVSFQGLDFLALLNLVLYLYTDTVIDVWHFTRQRPNMAYRFRQVRVELMKTASNLKMTKLEQAARLMREPDRQMNLDMLVALKDPQFLEDGDTLLELNGAEILAHSAILCQRCPFFDGLFNGRAGGQWLDARRNEGSDAVRIDLKHVDPTSFELVLRYLYADSGPELFDEIVCEDIDEFSELVMDVMGVANELMIDRLSQICQEVIGRFVTSRNVSQLLNMVAPCSVTAFKDAALEYLCLQLESMLENHLIDDLDYDLMLELDEVVRANQLNCLPFAKSGRAELLLHERYPSLAGDIDEERRRRIRDMSFRANLYGDDNRLSSSFRNRVGSLDDLMASSPTHEKSRRKSKAARNAPFSPSIRPKDSTADLMFDMDDEDPLAPGSPRSPAIRPSPDLRPSSRLPSANWNDNELLEDEPLSLPTRVANLGIQSGTTTPPSTSNTKKWSSPALPSTKLDMREIMAQTISTRVSALSLSLSAAAQVSNTTINSNVNTLAVNPTPPKLSQKERKKQQQQALQHALAQPQITIDKPSSPWQVATTGAKTSLKDVLSDTTPSPLNLSATPARPSPRRAPSPDTRFSGQARSKPPSKSPSTHTKPTPPQTPSKNTQRAQAHSQSYAGVPEPSLQLSMADIIGQQRREQEVIREAGAKRSLQEIQEEQAFQEWWDAESRRAQEIGSGGVVGNGSGVNNGGAAKSKGDGGKSGNGRGGKVGGRGKGGHGGGVGTGHGNGNGNGNAHGSGRGRGRGRSDIGKGGGIAAGSRGRGGPIGS